MTTDTETEVPEWTPTRPILRHLACGHSVHRRQHVWITRRGNDACRQECASRLEHNRK